MVVIFLNVIIYFYYILTEQVDHTGLVPIFNEKNGFKGNIYASDKTIEITKELLKDCCFIHKKNVDYLKSKGKKKDLLYTEVDLYNCFEHMKYIDINRVIDIDSNLKVEYRNNSHVVGSCNLTLWVKEYQNSRWKKICYTSDLGSKINFKYTPYLKEQDLPLSGNVLISEATYSDNDRAMTTKMAEKDRREMLEIIKEGLMNNRRILLPVFAFSKAQTMITFLYDNLSKEQWFRDGEYEIIMDGVLMNNINGAYSRILDKEDRNKFNEVMNWDRLVKVKDYSRTLEILSERKPCVILASSGFLENGKITTYLPYIVGCSKDVVVINGYCSQDNVGSIAYKLLNENQKTITFNIDGEKRVVLKRAKIYQQKSWSSHISNSELKDLFANVNYDMIICHHMDEKNKEKFLSECKEYLRERNKTTKIIATGKGSYEFII